jgi:hypothetical protein
VTVRELLKRDLEALGCDTRIYPNNICIHATPFIVLSLLLHAGWIVEPRPPAAHQRRGNLRYGVDWLRLRKEGTPISRDYCRVIVFPEFRTPAAYTDMLIGLRHQPIPSGLAFEHRTVFVEAVL